MSNTIEQFRELHKNTLPLLLPNAWDAGSARLFEDFGATAIATTSAGVAWSLGYQDGYKMPIDDVIALAFRITRAVSVPVSIDFENGYSDDPKVVANNVMRLADWGVAGINLEDGEDDPVLVARKIDAIRNAASKAGVDIFVNLRTDVVLFGLVEPARQVEESISRGNFYAKAGADGLFLPGISRSDDIQKVAEAVPLPLNVMSVPGLADSTELARLGVKRLSAGSGVAQAIWGSAEGIVSHFLKGGDQSPLFADAMHFGHLQELFGKD
ncbi:isocitrate lyase/phosphoenolpyruvate mutase family protein [Pseudomonas sp. RC10]|uniref:isocitrate lyase/PEP mutase family protein n=1 Tax=Pseudomonas bambusae TaxID=3139142 RepID=UPI003139BA95